MKSEELFAAKVGELKINGIQILTREEILKDPNIMLLGDNRGIPFDFIEGEQLTFPNNPVYWVHRFRVRKEDYSMLKCLAMSDRRGVIELPAPIFCRIPSLDEERQILFENNEVGKKLSEQMPDIRRFDILHDLKKIQVSSRITTLHQDGFYTDEAGVRHRVPDAVDLPNRRPITCYKFVKL